MSQADPVLAPATRALLSRYTLAPRTLQTFSGERLTREAGGSLEFFDTRPYGVGDELRYVDWKAYARTGRLMTRLFQAERTAALRVLLDTSPSMAVGGKLEAAQRVAALLVYAALGMPTQVERFGGTRSPRGGGPPGRRRRPGSRRCSPRRWAPRDRRRREASARCFAPRSKARGASSRR